METAKADKWEANNHKEALNNKDRVNLVIANHLVNRSRWEANNSHPHLRQEGDQALALADNNKCKEAQAKVDSNHSLAKVDKVNKVKAKWALKVAVAKWEEILKVLPHLGKEDSKEAAKVANNNKDHNLHHRVEAVDKCKAHK